MKVSVGAETGMPRPRSTATCPGLRWAPQAGTRPAVGLEEPADVEAGGGRLREAPELAGRGVSREGPDRVDEERALHPAARRSQSIRSRCVPVRCRHSRGVTFTTDLNLVAK